jgi:hypothetical protein
MGGVRNPTTKEMSLQKNFHQGKQKIPLPAAWDPALGDSTPTGLKGLMREEGQPVPIESCGAVGVAGVSPDSSGRRQGVN